MGIKKDTHIRGTYLFFRVLKLVPMFPEIFRYAQDDSFVIINVLLGVVGVKHSTRN